VAIEGVQELELNLDGEAGVTTDLQSFAVTEDQQAIRELASRDALMIAARGDKIDVGQFHGV
jgi:hypothetical protein